jgi:Xaa-Pro aminopeptidase
MLNFIPESELIQRRQKLFALMPDNSAFLVLSNPILLRNDDVEYPFRQNSNFWYFSSFDEPDSALILTKNNQKQQTFLFCRAKNPFKETWTGEILGHIKAQEIVKTDLVFEFAQILEKLPEILSDLNKIYFSLSTQNYPKLNQNLLNLFIETKLELLSSQEISQKLRLYKSDWEKTQLQESAKINILAHQFVLENREKYKFEYEIEADLLYFYKKNSLNWSYPPIVAGGQNATTLHYTKNDQKLDPNKLVLIDSGCEFNYYASDITRTINLANKTNSAQKTILELVQKANKETINLAKTCLQKNLTLKDLHDFSVKILCLGLKDLGILKQSLDEILEQKLYQKYYMHGTSHWLGLDVHDQGEYFTKKKSTNSKQNLTSKTKDSSNIEYQKLESGMCFTIEPGLYFAPNQSLEIPAEFLGIGVRIEDNIFLTQNECLNLTDF